MVYACQGAPGRHFYSKNISSLDGAGVFLGNMLNFGYQTKGR